MIQLVKRRSIEVIDIPTRGDDIGEGLRRCRNQQFVLALSEISEYLIVVQQPMRSISHGENFPKQNTEGEDIRFRSESILE